MSDTVAELARQALHGAVGPLTRGGYDTQHTVYIDSGDTSVQGLHSKVFHLCAPVVTVGCGTQGNHQIDRRRMAQGRGLGDSSSRDRFGPLYCSCCSVFHQLRGRRCATVLGSSQLGAGPVMQLGRAFIRIATSLTRCATVDSAPVRGALQGFHARGRGLGVMNG